MGLAASQARLLLLTARKSDVESQLMSIANQKLSLSRQAAAASEEYADALNSTKYTWDTDEGTVDLTYDLLMHPNTTADEGQYILTNAASGKVVLDSEYMSDLGLSGAGNPGDIANLAYTASDGTQYTGEKAFIMRLIGCTSSAADKYIAAGNTTIDNDNYLISYDDASIITSSIGLAEYDGTTTLGSKTTSSSKWIGSPSPGSSSVGDEVILSSFEEMLTSYSNSISNAVISSVSDSVSSDFVSVLKEASQYAYQATWAKFVCDIVDKDSTDGNITDGTKSLSTAETDYLKSGCTDKNRISNVTTSGGHGCIHRTKSSTTTVSLDNSQLADTYMSFFDKYCAEHSVKGVASSTVGASTTTRGAKGGTGGTGSCNTTAKVDAGDLDVNNNKVDDAYEASYYINLYNAIYNYGWQSDNNIDNKSYFNNQLSYGNISIKKWTEDGSTLGTWETLSTSDSDSPLDSEKDEDAIDEAKAEYESLKDQLDAKESELDIKMDDLDTERSAITTEMESVQNIIKKNVESFKMFDA